MYGPQLPFSQALHARKYRSEGESFADAMTRVAHALQDDTRHGAQLLEILLQMRFLPGGAHPVGDGGEPSGHAVQLLCERHDRR